MARKVTVIGGGFAGLSAAACLAQDGHHVHLLEKNSTVGGRARQFEVQGFTFDMGPSWYWMPEVFENFYQRFGHTTSEFYDLKRLDPAYRVFYGKDDFVDIPGTLDEIYELVESMERGGAYKLKKFLAEAKFKYELGMGEFVFKPGRSVLEFMDPRILKNVFRLHLFRSISSHIRKYFSDPRLIQIMEFPVLFLGAKPSETPALYSMMNYADWSLGTWYPMGGMYQIVRAMERICTEVGVNVETGRSVERISVKNKMVSGVYVDSEFYGTDIVVGSADYHHVEQQLVPEEYRMYSKNYWNRRTLSPSCLLFYIGLDKRVPALQHHNLFFDGDFDSHLKEIYDEPNWPSNPLFYVCCTSKTDPGTAPSGCENLFILIPVAVGLDDTVAVRDRYLEVLIKRLEMLTGEELSEHVVYKRSYGHKDYSTDYNAYKGNAFGLANTLRQTAIFKPSMRSKKLKNLFFAGQLFPSLLF